MSRAFDDDVKKEKESATIGIGSSEKKAAGSEKKEEEEAFVASASTDGDVKVWCVATGYLLATARGHADVCWHVRFIASLCDADAAFAVTAGRDGLAKTWRVPLRARSGDDDDDDDDDGGGAGVVVVVLSLIHI